ncbi:MAG TPA: HAD-IB family phosphatase [Gemmatimonadaceae bacterium]|nr:HAD-IB family phosphatase [Gemmatimonadaceae bacterium]
MSRFNSVILDVDSTLSGIEGIDWLAARRGAHIEAAVASLTDQAMEGRIPLEAVYGERLKMVSPTASQIADLASAYIQEIAPYAKEAIAEMAARKVKLFLVSGGLREAILPLATEVGVQEDNVHAVSIRFGENGEYNGFDEQSALVRQNGKRKVVKQLQLKGPTLAVGDGMTDCEIRPAVDGFAAYTGFIRRAPVIKQADYVIEDFRELRELILG